MSQAQQEHGPSWPGRPPTPPWKRTCRAAGGRSGYSGTGIRGMARTHRGPAGACVCFFVRRGPPGTEREGPQALHGLGLAGTGPDAPGQGRVGAFTCWSSVPGDNLGTSQPSWCLFSGSCMVSRTRSAPLRPFVGVEKGGVVPTLTSQGCSRGAGDGGGGWWVRAKVRVSGAAGTCRRPHRWVQGVRIGVV